VTAASARPRRPALPDPWLLLPVIALGLLGLVLVQATTADPVTLHPSRLSAQATRHALYLALGLVLIVAGSRFDYRLIRRLAPLVYLASLALLLLVLAVGSHEYGARRWLTLGGVSYQPSELAKLALIFAGAALLAGREPGVRPLLLWSAHMLLPGALILLEPDLGTTLVIGAAWAAVTVAWGLQWRLLTGIAVASIAVVPIAFTIAVPDYQRERIAVFVDPGRDPLGSGFTLRQVEVALGSGSWLGNGVLAGGGSALEGLSTRASDFAFAQSGEALGFLGAAAVIVLYALVAWRGARAAAVAPDEFGRLLALGLTATIAVQAALHIAVNLRLFPATGIALPFVSTGGSALVSMCTAIGVLESIAAHRPATPREQWTGERWR